MHCFCGLQQFITMAALWIIRQSSVNTRDEVFIKILIIKTKIEFQKFTLWSSLTMIYSTSSPHFRVRPFSSCQEKFRRFWNQEEFHESTHCNSHAQQFWDILESQVSIITNMHYIIQTISKWKRHVWIEYTHYFMHSNEDCKCRVQFFLFFYAT